MLLILVVPFLELWVIIEVWQSLGGLETLALLLLVSFAGAWLVRREGLGVWTRLNDQMAQGRVPTTELIDGPLILFAGALLLTPGFLTDIVGILLLLPPVRAGIRGLTRRRLTRRLDRYGAVRLVTWGAKSAGGPSTRRPPMERTDMRRTDVTDVRVVDPPELEP